MYLNGERSANDGPSFTDVGDAPASVAPAADEVELREVAPTLGCEHDRRQEHHVGVQERVDTALQLAACQLVPAVDAVVDRAIAHGPSLAGISV